jgi:hypothetical protein
MPTPYGWDTENIEAPKFVSRGEWDITGTKALAAFQPLNVYSTTFDSGIFGESGIYRVRQFAAPYDDKSGISGCIGVTLRRIETATNTGLRNQNLGNRKMAVLHEGYCYMEYKSGYLDGSVKTLQYGDKIAPCISGFRVYEEINIQAVSGMDGTEAVCITTGIRQCHLGWYADAASDATGTWKRVKINPHYLYGAHKD